MCDLLELILFVDDEVFLPQARHEPPGAIGHGRRHVDQVDAAAEAELLLLLSCHVGAAGQHDGGGDDRETDPRTQHVFHGKRTSIQ